MKTRILLYLSCILGALSMRAQEAQPIQSYLDSTFTNVYVTEENEDPEKKVREKTLFYKDSLKRDTLAVFYAVGLASDSLLFDRSVHIAYENLGRIIRTATYREKEEGKEKFLSQLQIENFNEQKQKTLHEFYLFTEEGERRGISKWIREYYENGRTKNYTRQKWDEFIKNWYPEIYIEYAISFEGDLESIKTTRWESSGSQIPLMPVSRELRVKRNDQTVFSVEEDYQEDDGTWDTITKVEYVFDDDFQLQLRTVLHPIDATLYPHEKDEFDYDLAGNRVEHRHYEWNFSIASWEEISRRNYTWDEQNRLLSELRYTEAEFGLRPDRLLTHFYEGDIPYPVERVYYSWDVSTADWIGDFKYESIYRDDGYLKERRQAVWDPELEAFRYTLRTMWEYNDRDLLTREEEQKWSKEEKAWKGSNLTEFTVEDTVLTREKEYYWIDEQGYVPRLAFEYFHSFPVQDTNGNGNPADTTSQPNELTQIVEAPTNWKVYPNPAADRIILDYNGETMPVSWTLFSLRGRVVGRGTIFNGYATADISMLPAGLYILSIQKVTETEEHIISKF